MPESHNVWVQYMESQENSINNSFQGPGLSVLVLSISWTALNKIISFQEHLHAWNIISTYSKRSKKTKWGVIHPQAQEYTILIPTKYKDLHSWADCINSFILVITKANKIHCVPIGAKVVLVHSVQENAASDRIDNWI